MAKDKPIQQEHVLYELCAQEFDLDGDQNHLFIVKNKINGETVPIRDIDLFYHDDWLREFALADIRKIALSVMETNLSKEKAAIAELQEKSLLD